MAESYVHCFTAPIPNVMITAPNTQIVGQSLTLECSVALVEGITNMVDIEWGQEDGSILRRVADVSINYTSNNTDVFLDTYVITLLSTVDNGRVYMCGTVINSSNSSIMSTSNITLNVNGEILSEIKYFILLFIIHSSYSYNQYNTIWSYTRSYGR